MRKFIKFAVIAAVLVFAISTLTGCVVWNAERRGRAALAQARYQMQVIEVEAQQRMVAETYNAEAEIIRAHGIAEAMRIIKSEITLEYLKHFWIRTLAEHDGVIYISLESGFPVMLNPGK